MMTPKSTSKLTGTASESKAASKTVKKTHDTSLTEMRRKRAELDAEIASEEEVRKTRAMNAKLEVLRAGAAERARNKGLPRYAMVSPSNPNFKMKPMRVRDYGEIQPYTWYLLNAKQYRNLITQCKSPRKDLTLLPAGMKPTDVKVVEVSLPKG